MTHISISVIIPTINRYVDLLNTIADLKAQTTSSFEIIIIDQTDDVDEAVVNKLKADGQIRYIHSIIKSASAARNIGIRAARAEVLLFLDDDIIVQDVNYLSYFIHHFSNNAVVGVVGPIIDSKTLAFREDRHRWSYNKSWGWLFFPRNYSKPCMINDGGAGNLAVRTENTFAIGGMDENFEKGAHREEADFNTRYTSKHGWYVYDPQCMIVHIGRNTGGVRSWNKNLEIKAQHHFDGACYYILKNVNLRFYPIHFAATLFYFVLKKEFIKNPILYIKSGYRFGLGLHRSIKAVKKGPQYLINE